MPDDIVDVDTENLDPETGLGLPEEDELDEFGAAVIDDGDDDTEAAAVF